MSAQGTVSSARPLRRLASFVIALALLAAVFVAGTWFRSWTVVEGTSPDRSRVAYVTDRTCGESPCQSLWIGTSVRNARSVATLARGSEQCDAVVWTKDSRRVAFLINAYQLRIYNAETGMPAGQVDLLQRDGTPTSRIARGVTFSDNGRAVTFDDCPRVHSGCRAGLIGVPD